MFLEPHFATTTPLTQIFPQKILKICFQNFPIVFQNFHVSTNQKAFNRTEFSELCTEICHEKPILSLVGYLHEYRNQMQNEQLLKTARSLLRLTWSLTYSTISDFLDSLRPYGNNNRFTIEELGGDFKKLPKDNFCELF